MKTIMAAAIASLMLSGTAFAAAPAITKEAPKATAQQAGTILLAAGSQRPGNLTGLMRGGLIPLRGACAICG